MFDYPPDGVAFQVFIWNRRRYAIPIDAKGAQLGPPLYFRNVNRLKRKGYGPGSSNTSLVEETCLPPLPPSVDAAAPSDGRSSSFSSMSTNSSPGRNGRHRLGRSVSFCDRAPSELPHTTPIACPERRGVAPPSILRKKSSFHPTLRPLFDFEYEPSHPPCEGKKQETEKQKRGVEQDESVTSTSAADASKRALQLSLSISSTIEFDDVEELRTPPSLAPHRRSDPGICFVPRSNDSAATILIGGLPLAPKNSNGELVVTERSPYLTPTTETMGAAVESPQAKSSSLKLLECSPSLSKDAVAFVRAALPSPLSVDFFRVMRLSLLFHIPQAEMEVGALSSFSPELQTDVSSAAALTIATHAPRHRRHLHQRRHHQRSKKDAQNGQDAAAAALEKSQSREMDNAHEAAAAGEWRREPDAGSAAGQANERAEAPSQRQYAFDDDRAAPRYCGGLPSPTVHAAVVLQPNAAFASASESNSADCHAFLPRVSCSSEVVAAQLSRAFGTLGDSEDDDQRNVTVSPFVHSSEDVYETCRYVTPHPTTLTAPTTPSCGLLPTTVWPTKTEGSEAAAAAPGAQDGEEYRGMYHYPPLGVAAPTLLLRSAPPPPRHGVEETPDPHGADAVAPCTLLDDTFLPATEGKEMPSNCFALPSLMARLQRNPPVQPSTLPAPHPVGTLSPAAGSSRSISSLPGHKSDSVTPTHDSSTEVSLPADSGPTCEYGVHDNEGEDDDGYGRVTTFPDAPSENRSVEGGASACSAPNETKSTTVSSSCGLLQSNLGPIWSTMVRRLRKLLIVKPPAEEHADMHQVSCHCCLGVLVASRARNRPRGEAARSVDSDPSPVETEGAVNPLRRFRRVKQDPLPKTSWRRRKSL